MHLNNYFNLIIEFLTLNAHKIRIIHDAFVFLWVCLTVFHSNGYLRFYIKRFWLLIITFPFSTTTLNLSLYGGEIQHFNTIFLFIPFWIVCLLKRHSSKTEETQEIFFCQEIVHLDPPFVWKRELKGFSDLYSPFILSLPQATKSLIFRWGRWMVTYGK